MSKPFRYRYFATYPFGFQVFNQIGARRYFQLVEKKKCFARENAKKVVEGLETGLFVAAIQRCSCKKVFLKYAANLQENTHAEV